MNQEVQSNQINNILAKCWADESFKKKLLANPTEVLKAEGVDIPAGYTVHVLENTDKIINYVLPPNPNAELSDSELESVAGGKAAAPSGIVSISRQEMQKMGMHDATRGY
jgi:hypothetical protein